MKYIILIAALTTLIACSDEQQITVPLFDEQAVCEVNGGEWHGWVACDEDGKEIDRGGVCDCTPVVIGMGVVCEKAMEDFFDEDL